MSLTRKCLILAAGNGTRLRAVSANLPKPLVAFQRRPILEHVLNGARAAGIEEFVIVLGYRGHLIRHWVETCWSGQARFTFVENPDYHKSNGISALKARHALDENFLLLMADHIFEPETARMMLRQQLGPREVMLGVDPKIDRIFDMDDATKVRRIGEWIVEIGKDIQSYDAIDTGMFLCSPALFDDLDHATTDGNCSLSDGMRRAASQGRLRGLEIGDAAWDDLDTPEALAHAEAEALEYAA